MFIGQCRDCFSLGFMCATLNREREGEFHLLLWVA